MNYGVYLNLNKSGENGLDIHYEKIQIGDRLVCQVISDGELVPVEHIVTKSGLNMFGIRMDINKEVEILATSILEHKQSE